MTKQLEYFFDVQCPFAYLASTQMRALATATGAELIYRPVLLGGIYNALQDGGPYKKPLAASRVRLGALDAQRWATYWGKPLLYAPGHPVRSVLAMRVVLASGDIPKAAHALFEAAWAKGKAISEPSVLTEALEQAGFADVEQILSRAESEAIKEELRTRTNDAVQRGVFGVPTFFVDGDMFWGQDRLDFVARALGATGYRPELPHDAAARPSRVQVWFDYSSPYAYLGVSQIERIAAAAGAEVVFRPFLLGGLFREIGTADVPLMAWSEAKRRYMTRELARWAEHWKVPFRFTSRFPMRTLLPLRATYALLHEAPAQASPFIHAVFHALWVDDRDISQPEVLQAICTEAGLDPTVIERANAPEHKQALLVAGAEAVKVGLCGAPTFAVDGTLFWGQDRLPMVEAALRGFRFAGG